MHISYRNDIAWIVSGPTILFYKQSNINRIYYSLNASHDSTSLSCPLPVYFNLIEPLACSEN